MFVPIKEIEFIVKNCPNTKIPIPHGFISKV